jgi:glucose/arabinose dehydrogenase
MLLALLACTGTAVAQPLGLQPIASGFVSPVSMANAGDGSKRLFIVEQGGTIRIYNGSQVLATPFLNITSKVLSGGERGLLGLAFDANYVANGFFYVFYTSQPAGQVTISRYKVSADPNVADLNSELVLKTQDHSQAGNHNGGSLLWGPDDGCLYAGIGDGGTGGANGQDLTTLLGKIIRISPTDGTPCPGNPSFGGVPGARPEIWALGLRNPWRITFDRQTHDLFIADVGEATWEEVNFQPAGSGGRNYCWNLKEGPAILSSVPCTIGIPTDPILFYDHTAGNCAVIGGYRYRGSRFPALAGTYFYGDLCSHRIWGGVQSGGTWTSSPLLIAGFQFSSFGEDEAGEVYVLQYSSSATLYRVVVLQQTSTHDFNSGGISDVLWRQTGGMVVAWLMNGASVIGGGSPGSAGSDWAIVGQRDFNGDGFADVLWRNGTTGQAVVWLMNGGSAIGGGSPGSAANPWSVAGTGDFNGDGFGDILWYNTSTGQAVVWFLNGTSVIGGGSPGSAANPWTVAGTGDFNDDGKSDILWRNNTTGQVVIWFLDGASVIGGGSPGMVTSDWVIAGTGDFNGDHMSDILWRNTNTGQVLIWLLNGASVISVGSPGSAISDWAITETGDFNSDGMSDILWRNTVNGQVAMWFMNGTSATGGGSPGIVTTDWVIQGMNAD